VSHHLVSSLGEAFFDEALAFMCSLYRSKDDKTKIQEKTMEFTLKEVSGDGINNTLSNYSDSLFIFYSSHYTSVIPTIVHHQQHQRISYRCHYKDIMSSAKKAKDLAKWKVNLAEYAKETDGPTSPCFFVMKDKRLTI